LYINPTNFQVNIAMKKDINGVMTMSHDPNDFTTVNALRNRIKAKYDRFDSDSFIKNKVAALGEEIRAYKTAASQTQAGVIGVQESIRVRDGFLEAQAAQLNEALVIPDHVSSILTDEIGSYEGKKFTPSWEVPPTEGRDPSIIYLKNENGKVVIDITEQQKEIARKHLTQKMDMMLDFKETIGTYTNPQKPNKTAAEIDQENAAKDLKDGYYYWNLIRTGTDAEKLSAIRWLNGSNFLKAKNIDSLGFSDDGKAVVINYGSTIQNVNGIESGSKPSFQTVRLYDSNENVLEGDDWMAASTEVFGNISPQEANKFAIGGFRQAENPAKIRVGKNIGYDPTVTGTGSGNPAPADGSNPTGGRPR
jgi:hypothetical protein